MQYTDYINAYNAQRERQAQLVQKYNQTPVLPKNRFIWQQTTVEKHDTGNIGTSEVIGAIVGMVIVAIVIVVSMWV